MRLKVAAPQTHHKDMVTALCWTPTNELYTCSDDGSVSKWDLDGEHQGKVCDLDSYVTDMHWFPSVGKQSSDTFAVACSDGRFLVARAGAARSWGYPVRCPPFALRSPPLSFLRSLLGKPSGLRPF